MGKTTKYNRAISMRRGMLAAVTLTAVVAATAFAAETDGWRNQGQKLPFPDKSLWHVSGEGSFAVEMQGGAKGHVRTLPDGSIEISKSNGEGCILVTAKACVPAKPGTTLRAMADVCCTNAGPEESFGFLRLAAKREDLAEIDLDAVSRLKLWGWGGVREAVLVNTAQGTTERKHASCRAGKNGTWAAIAVCGAPSVSVWSGWRVAEEKECARAWAKYRRAQRPEAWKNRTDTPCADEAEYLRTLAGEPDHVARVVGAGGEARLEVDGREEPPILYKGPSWQRSRRIFPGSLFGPAGVRLHVLPTFRFGSTSTNGFWRPEGFDAKGMVADIGRVMRTAPDSLCVLSLGISPYPTFAVEHLEEAWRLADGRAVYGTDGHSPFPIQPTVPTNCYVWTSPCSKLWREAVKTNFTALVAELKRTGLNKRIVGVHLAGFHDGQFATRHPDCSRPAVAEFRRWLARKYGSDAELSRAWRRPGATITAAEAPEFPDADWLVPGRDDAAIDFMRFLKGSPFEVQEEMWRHLKAEFGKEMLAIRWCMGTFGGSYCSAHDITAFARSGVADVIVPQPDYRRRAPGMAIGNVQPLASFRAHGKLMLFEFDLRTWTIRKEQDELREMALSLAHNIGQWRSMHRKLAGRQFASHAGFWYYDMGPGWFNTPEIMENIRDIVRTGRDLAARTRGADAWKPSVAFVVDEEGLLLRNSLGPGRYSGEGALEQETTVARQELKLTQAGIPHDVWLMADWLERPELHAGYRLAVLTGLNCIDAKRRMLIERLKRTGVKVLATAGAGRCGGADALEGCMVAADAVGFRPARIISLVKEAGGYAPADRPGLEVDTDGAFMSVHCLRPGRWTVRLPFAADVVNLKSGQAERTDGDALTLELDAGTTCWFRLERRR